MPKYNVIAKKTQKLLLEIEADSEEDALQMAEDDPDQFEEFDLDVDDGPEYKFEIEK